MFETMQTSWVPSEAVEVWIDAALSVVARHVAVNKWAILSRRRDRAVVRARRLFVAVLRHELGLSLPEIAYMLGMDHSGVLYSSKQVMARDGEEVEADDIAARLPSAVLARRDMDLVRFSRWKANYLAKRSDRKSLLKPDGIVCPRCQSVKVKPMRQRPGVFCVECNHEFVPPGIWTE